MFGNTVWKCLYDNDLDAFIPEVWAQESLMVLYENLIAAQMVHREFTPEIASFGDVVNTRRPGKFVSVRKTDADPVTTQNATAENVAIRLDQHHHISFVIKDGEETKGMKNLITTYLTPAMEGVAKGIDEAVIGQKYSFIGNVVGKLGTSPTISTIVDAGVKLDTQLAPDQGRMLLISPSMKGSFQKIDTFYEADKIGDNGTALRTGALGTKFGFGIVSSQNQKVISASDVVTGAINHSAGYDAETTSITVDGFSAAITNGSWLVVDGDGTPQMVTATSGGSTPTSITLSPGLQNGVVNNATVTVYKPALVNYSDGYAQYYSKDLAVDGISKAIRTGQMVSNGATSATGAYKYSSMTSLNGASASSVLLNRTLDASLANNAVLGLGPAGDYGLAFHRNAIALISRPLSTPMPGTGARSAVMDMDGIGLRVVITYDGNAQGHRVTVDVLAGVKTLDTNLGVMLLG